MSEFRHEDLLAVAFSVAAFSSVIALYHNFMKSIIIKESDVNNKSVDRFFNIIRTSPDYNEKQGGPNISDNTKINKNP